MIRRQLPSFDDYVAACRYYAATLFDYFHDITPLFVSMRHFLAASQRHEFETRRR